MHDRDLRFQQQDAEPIPKIMEYELLTLAWNLGFTETSKLTDLRNSVVPELDAKDFPDLIGQYNLFATEIDLPDSSYEGTRAQIGVGLATAAIISRCGLETDVQEYLEEAMEVAANIGDEEAQQALESLIN